MCDAQNRVMYDAQNRVMLNGEYTILIEVSTFTKTSKENCLLMKLLENIFIPFTLFSVKNKWRKNE